VTASTTFSGTDKRQVTFNVQTGDGVVRYIDDDVEVHWQMEYWSMGTTREYTTGSATAIATWDSGKAAIARSNLGTGRAYMFGWRLKNVVADAELQNIPTTPEPQWVNTQVLDADIARLLVRGIYETLPGSPHVRQMAPNGKPAALILTHDVDARVSYDNLPQYLALENAQGVKSTYLFTTAPYDSGWVETMYTASGKANIQSALDQGFDIQSHSFDHYRDFDKAPYGTGNENAANYLPHYSADLGYTIGSSALGELGVSRWLLRHDFGVAIPAFRSGYLLMPANFLAAVQQIGYRRDSTYAAGLTRGFTPFVPFKMVNGAPVTYRFVEYPMGLEDRNLDATNVTQIVDSWEKVIRTNYKNGVPTVINVHPVNQPRIDAMTLLFQRISDLNIWIGDWKTFGDFWESQGMTCSRWP
jgi:peptidoglycan/xylan/chitin deacetylase (PgdA/CDA1 family)